MSQNYIGIGTSPYGCSIITSFSSRETKGRYLVARIWNENKMTYKGIICELIQALKMRERSLEEIMKARNEFMLINNMNEQDMRIHEQRNKPCETHHYSILFNRNEKLKNELEELKLKYTNPFQRLSFKISNPKSQINNAVAIMSGLINDEMISFGNDLDIEEIQKEINSLVNPESFNNISPQLTALALALGEAEFRRVNRQEDRPINWKSFATGMLSLHRSMARF